MTDPPQAARRPAHGDPFADERTQPFWDAALEGRLLSARARTAGPSGCRPRRSATSARPGRRMDRAAGHRPRLHVHGRPSRAPTRVRRRRPVRVAVVRRRHRVRLACMTQHRRVRSRLGRRRHARPRRVGPHERHVRVPALRPALNWLTAQSRERGCRPWSSGPTTSPSASATCRDHRVLPALRVRAGVPDGRRRPLYCAPGAARRAAARGVPLPRERGGGGVGGGRGERLGGGGRGARRLRPRVAAVRSELVRRGHEVTEVRRGRGGFDFCFVADPDGMWVEILQDDRDLAG